MEESEELYRLFFEKTLDGMLLADAETQQLLASNKAMDEMLGYTSEQIKKLRVPDLHQKKDLPYVLDQFEKLSKREINVAKDVPMKRRDGTTFYADVTGTAVTLAGRAHLLGSFRNVTERWQTEKALRESEARYRSLFEESLYGICTAGPDLKFRQVNAAFCRLLEYREEELVGKRGIGDVTHPDDIATSKKLLGKLIDHEIEFFIVEKRYVAKSGRIIYAITFVRGIYDESGRYEGAIASVTDITDRRQKEEALQESEEELKTIFSTIRDSITISNISDGRIFEANAKLLGYTREEMIGKTTTELGLWANTEDRRRMLQAIKSEGHVEDLEVKLRRKDGTIIIASLSTNLIKFDGKSFLLSVTRDITDRKQKEEALQESEAKYRTLVEQSLQGIVIAQGSPLRLVFANSAMGKILGYTPVELTSLSPEETEALVHPEDRAVFFGRFMDRLQGKYAPASYEVRGIRKDGEVCWLELFSAKIEFNGQPAVQATFVDITGRRQAEKAVTLQRDRALKFLDVVEAIIVIIQANETVSLMNRKGCEILGCEDREILGKNWFDTFIPMRGRKRVRDGFAELMKGQTKQLAFFCSNVLSKSGEERTIAWHNSVLMDERGNIYAALSYGQDITGRTDLVQVRSEMEVVKARVQAKAMAEALGFDYMDQERIASATLELARNAFRYAGGGDVKIQPVERDDRGGIEITVEDHGPGIANLELVLKGGYSTSNRLGEGLSNCRRLMDEFDIKTKVGEGTLVRITKWL